MRKKLWFVLFVVAILAMSSVSHATQYKIKLHILDNSGSMANIFEGEDTRSDVAKGRIIARAATALGNYEYNGLMVFSGDTIEMANDFVLPAEISEIIGTKDGDGYWSGGELDTIEAEFGPMTPLADAICQGMTAINEKDDEIRAQLGADYEQSQISIFIYTDGYENYSEYNSFDEVCAQTGDASNGYLFVPNAHSMRQTATILRQ